MRAHQRLGQVAVAAHQRVEDLQVLGMRAPAARRVVEIDRQAPLARGVLDVSDGGNRDLVVFDDLLFGEPQGL